jgi:hypothetical protein
MPLLERTVLPRRHPVPLRWDVMAVLVQLEWQDGNLQFGRVIPYVTLRLSTNIRSMHHAAAGGINPP